LIYGKIGLILPAIKPAYLFRRSSLLVLLGLIIVLLAPALANPRMGVYSHIEGVLIGILLIVLGLIWHRLDLSEKWLKITFWLAVYGTFANWFGLFFAAIFNAGKMLNFVANGQEGTPFAEGVVIFCLFSLTVAMLSVSLILLFGFGRTLKSVNFGKR
jgi:hydroxylaminobenzene mutase